MNAPLPPALGQLLTAWRWRRTVEALLRGGSEATVVACLLLVILAVADALVHPSPETRQAGAWTMLVVVLVTACWRIAREQWRRRDPVDELRHLEQRAGLADELLSTGVQFAMSPPAGSAWMAQRTVALAAVRAAALSSRELPFAVWRRTALVAGAAVAVVALACIPSGGRALVWRALAPFGDTSRPSLVAVTVAAGDQVVTAGATVLLVARTEPMATAAAAELRWDDGATERVPLVAEASGEWRGAVGPVQSSFRWRVLAGDGESPARRVQVVPRARLEWLRLRITPPAYARQPERLVIGGDTTVVVGSRIQVEGEVTGDPPVAGVLVAGSQELALAIVDRRISVNWSPPHSTTFALRLVGAGGVITVLPQRWFVAVKVDHPPQVALLAPLGQAVVAGLGLPVPLTVQAGDDLGLASLGLRVGGPSGRLREVPLPASGQGVVVVSILPEAEGLRPGDLLEVQAEAVDLGGQRSLSQQLSVNVVDAAAGRCVERATVMDKVAAAMANADAALADCLKHWAEAVRLARPDDATAWRSEARLIGERLAVVRTKLMATVPAWRSAAAGLPLATMVTWHQWADAMAAWDAEVGTVLAAPLAELASGGVDLDQLPDALLVAQALAPEVTEMARAAGQAAQAAAAMADASRCSVVARRLEDGRRAVAVAADWAGVRAATVATIAAWYQARLAPAPAALSATAGAGLADQLAARCGAGAGQRPADAGGDAIVAWATAAVARAEQRATLAIRLPAAPAARQGLLSRLRANLVVPGYAARPLARAMQRAAAGVADSSWRMALAQGGDVTVRLLAAEVLRQAAAPPEALAKLAEGATAAERAAVATWAARLGQAATDLDSARRAAALRQVGHHLATAQRATVDGRLLAASRQRALAVALVAGLEPTVQVLASARLDGDLAWFLPALRPAPGADEAFARLVADMPAVPVEDRQAVGRARRAVLVALAEAGQGAVGRVDATEAVLMALTQGAPLDTPLRVLLASEPGPRQPAVAAPVGMVTPAGLRRTQAKRLRDLLPMTKPALAPGLPLAALQQALLQQQIHAPGVMAMVEALPADAGNMPASTLATAVTALQPAVDERSATAVAAAALRGQLLAEAARRAIARAAVNRELVAAMASGAHMLPETRAPAAMIATVANLEASIAAARAAAAVSGDGGTAWWRAVLEGNVKAEIPAAAAWLAARAHQADTLRELHQTQARLGSEGFGVADPAAGVWPLVRGYELSATIASLTAEGLIAGLLPPEPSDDDTQSSQLRRLAVWLADELERPVALDALPTPSPRRLMQLTMIADGGSAAAAADPLFDDLIARVVAGATAAAEVVVQPDSQAQQSVSVPVPPQPEPSSGPAPVTGWAGMDQGAWTRGDQGEQRQVNLRYLEEFPTEQQDAIRAYRRRLEGR